MLETIDLRLKCPFSMLLSGSSGSGKTQLVARILSHRETLYDHTPSVGRVVYFYKEYQPLFDQLKADGTVNEFRNEVVTMDWLRTFCAKHHNSTIVIDDMALEADMDLGQIFAVGAHHFFCNIILITQNLFWKNKYSRDISLQATYIILTKNIRDKSQISRFASQFDTGNAKTIRDIFEKATQKAYSYLIFDMHQKTEDSHRLISNLFCENQEHAKLYVRN